jgi:hypothetical protein
MKTNHFLVVLQFFLATTACVDPQKLRLQQEQQDIKNKRDALSLTLESNLKFRELSISCGKANLPLNIGIGGRNLVSKFILIPINKEVIYAVVNYKAALEKLGATERRKLLEKGYAEFLNANKTTFMIIISNNPKLDSAKESIHFAKIEEGMRLRLEKNEYLPLAITPNFMSSLNPGWNDGYIQFGDFRGDYKGSINAYSVNFDGFHMSCGDVKTSQNWAFLFDESEVNYLALIQKGLSKEEIKSRYIVNSYESIGLSQLDVENLIKIAAKTFSAYSSVKFLPRL